MISRPHSFEDLYYINRVFQPNFKSAYLKMELLEDEKEKNKYWKKILYNENKKVVEILITIILL